MILSDLSATAFQARLQNEGVYLRTGEFTYRVRSDVGFLSEALQTLYADFPLRERCEFSDFHVDVDRCRPFSQRFRTHVIVAQRGHFETTPVPVDQSVAYLEWSLNRCIFSQIFDRLLLHGGVVERDGRGVIITGNSGAGKSTLVAALCLHGWRLLSDEITVVSPHDGSVMGLARPVALKNQSIDVVRSLSADVRLGPVSSETPKGVVAHMRPPAASVRDSGKPVWPACIIFVNFRSGSRLRATPVTRARAFMRLAEYAGINYGVTGELGFRSLAEAVDDAVCLDLQYGDTERALKFFDSEFQNWGRAGAYGGASKEP